jgi:hypothetical protein
MKLLVGLMLSLSLGHAQLMAQSPTRPEILVSYADLHNYRTNADAILQGGQGVMVIKPDEGSALKALDIVVSFNKQPVQSVNQLLTMTEAAPAEQSIDLILIRAGKTHSLKLSKKALQAVYSDMLAAQVNELMSSRMISDNKPNNSQDAMIHEYLKGRPYRTPNNRDDMTKDNK